MKERTAAMGTRSSRLNIKTFRDAAREELAYMKGRMSGDISSLRTRWSKFNQASMNGIEWGNIITFAGMSGSGKTAILNELETSLFEENPNQDFVVLSFNFEMQARRLIGRKISAKLNKTVKQLYSADLLDTNLNLSKKDLKEARDYLNSIRNTPVYYVEMPGTPAQIEETVLEFSQSEYARGKSVLISLDHSILVKKSEGKDQLGTLYDLGTVANNTKKRIECAWVFLSQLNRSIESVDRRQNPDLHYPTKGDIFGSDALYQFSDLVVVPHRPEMLGITSYGPDSLPTKDWIYWHYLKVRDGDPLIAKMINDLKHNRVREYQDVSKKKWGTSGT